MFTSFLKKSETKKEDSKKKDGSKKSSSKKLSNSKKIELYNKIQNKQNKYKSN